MPEPEEDAPDFAGNARIKRDPLARAGAQVTDESLRALAWGGRLLILGFGEHLLVGPDLPARGSPLRERSETKKNDR